MGPAAVTVSRPVPRFEVPTNATALTSATATSLRPLLFSVRLAKSLPALDRDRGNVPALNVPVPLTTSEEPAAWKMPRAETVRLVRVREGSTTGALSNVTVRSVTDTGTD